MMQSLGKSKLNVSRILGAGATGLLLVGVACGAAATATPVLTKAPQPPAAQPATPAPTTRLAATRTATPYRRPPLHPRRWSAQAR